VHEKRTSTRHDVSLRATIEIGGDTHETQLLNLSLGGALIAHSGRVPTGERVRVTFNIPTHDKPIEVGGSVRWASESALGIQFDGLRAREVWSLNKFFESMEE
jgi:hypothetical protein